MKSKKLTDKRKNFSQILVYVFFFFPSLDQKDEVRGLWQSQTKGCHNKENKNDTQVGLPESMSSGPQHTKIYFLPNDSPLFSSNQYWQTVYKEKS